MNSLTQSGLQLMMTEQTEAAKISQFIHEEAVMLQKYKCLYFTFPSNICSLSCKMLNYGDFWDSDNYSSHTRKKYVFGQLVTASILQQMAKSFR